ncbi:MAG: maltose alpha-D-glucosyltransferase, partial [Acidimicrobiia bacterium]
MNDAASEASDRWYQDAVIYQLHVRAFQDSNGDGIGDFRGLTQRLDYLQDLGVTAIWLLPFYPSPLKDDGYDIADYKGIHPSYGTMRDFDRFLGAAHERGLKVITELVINHTSDQHEWFQRARKAPPGSRERDFYVWSDSPERYKDARIIFTDTEPSNWSWDPVANAYYWHRFFSHQPDLNFESEAVREAVFDALDFWLGKGVDGLRLDAVPYLYEREGTMCENLPETHAFLKSLRSRVDDRFSDRMLLAEANQWPEDAVAYFGDGDECHMCFHFPLMPRLFMSVKMENRFPIIDILDQTPPLPDSAAWAIFLRNHDELTLEMVTDEERDFMYRVYADDPQARINLGIRRRLAPLLRNDRRLIELLNALLLSLPGTPVLYYGDEIGMGDNIYLGDRNGVRTPMQWSPDRNAGFSLANPHRLFFPVNTDPEYHYESVNVEAEQANPSSLWWWMKRMLAQRRGLPALSQGDLRFLSPDNPKVLAFERTHGLKTVLVVANLSARTQAVEIDLAHHEGIAPVEIFGRTPFPTVGELPYFLTPGPYQFYWFLLDHEQEGAEEHELPRIRLRNEIDADSVFRARGQLARSIGEDLPRRRWFRSKAGTISDTQIIDVIPLDDPTTRLVIAQVDYVERDAETYLLPVSVVTGEEAFWLEEHKPETIVARVSGPDDTSALLVDAAGREQVGHVLLDLVRRRRKLKGSRTELSGSGTIGRNRALDASVTVLGAEQSNTSMAFGQELILKLFRKLEEGENPDVEISRYLSQRRRFPHMAPVRGVISAATEGGRASVGLIQDYVANQGDAWSQTVSLVGQFIDRVMTLPDGDARRSVPGRARHPLDLIGDEAPQPLVDLV